MHASKLKILLWNPIRFMMMAKKEQRYHYHKDSLKIPVASKTTLQAQRLIVVSAIFATVIPFVAIFFVVGGNSKSLLLLPVILGTVFSAVIVFYLINKRKSDVKKTNKQLDNPATTCIVISPHQLSFPASLSYGKNPQRYKQEGDSVFVFDISSITDLETQPGSKNSPPQFIVKLKRPGADEDVFRFKNPLKTEQKKEMYKALHRLSGLPEDRSPFSETAQSFRKKKYAYFISFVFAGVFGFIGFFTLLLVSTPLHYYSAVLTFGLYAVAMGCGLALAFKNNLFSLTLQKGFGTETPLWLYFLTMIAVSTNLIIGIDRFVASRTQRFEAPVTSKRVVRNKNSRSYRLKFDLIEPQAQYLLKIDESSEVRVAKKIFKKAMVDRSMIKGELKMGFLGVPYISSYNIESPSKRRTKKIEDSQRPPIKELKNWQAQFPKFPAPDKYQTVNYPDGALRSKIPLVAGKYHGVAEYFHANGQLYGKITWVEGQKEGRHQLFRPDGSLEGDFSYHRGQLHGESRWYDSSGALRVTRIFSHGKPVQ